MLDGKTDELLRELPASCGCPCIRCGRTGRNLQFRTLEYRIGFVYWVRTQRWTGYACGNCARELSLFSIAALFICSTVLVHPQAIFWAPITIYRNIANWVKGCEPMLPMAFAAEEVVAGRISGDALQLRADVAALALSSKPEEQGALLLGAMIVLAGIDDRAFAEDVFKMLLQCRDSSWTRPWAKKVAGEVERLGGSPDQIKASVPKTPWFRLR